MDGNGECTWNRILGRVSLKPFQSGACQKPSRMVLLWFWYVLIQVRHKLKCFRTRTSPAVMRRDDCGSLFSSTATSRAFETSIFYPSRFEPPAHVDLRGNLMKFGRTRQKQNHFRILRKDLGFPDVFRLLSQEDVVVRDLGLCMARKSNRNVPWSM